MAKCDLHVHSYHSGKTNHVKLLEPMDSYSTPDRIKAKSLERGMDFTTISDHNSISGCLEYIGKHPDDRSFFISEEVSIRLAEYSYCLHIGVYHMQPEDHAEIQRRRRRSLPDLLAYLRERNLFHVWNHPFYAFPRGEKGEELLRRLVDEFPFYEGINGCMPYQVNDTVCRGIAGYRKGENVLVAGSDAHSLLRVGKIWTEAAGDTPETFFESLRRGEGKIFGNRARMADVFNDAMSVYLGYMRDIAARNEIHRNWSAFKKIRNSVGWALWLPVFTAGAYAYAALQFRILRKRNEYFRGLWDRISS